jgi:hypothetical protein
LEDYSNLIDRAIERDMVKKKAKGKLANLRKAIVALETTNQGNLNTNKSAKKNRTTSIGSCPAGQSTEEMPSRKVTIRTPPVTIGTSIREVNTTTRKTGTGLVLNGRDFVCETSSSTGMVNGASLLSMIPLHPAYYPGTVMGNLSRSYEKYRFLRITLHFVTRAPTSTNGELWMHQVDNINEPVLPGDSTTFNAKVLSSRTALLGPVWMNHSMPLKTDSIFRFVDAFVSTDANDNILGEVRLHCTTASQVGIGFLMWDYELEFQKPFYQLHTLPIATGPGTLYSATLSSATPTSGDAFELTQTTLSALQVGTVLRISIDTLSSSAPTGTTFANLLAIATKNYTNSAATLSTSTTAVTMSVGFTCYGVVTNSTDITCYGTYDNAVAGAATGGLYYATTGSSVGSFRICAYVVRFAPIFSTYVQT